MVIILSQSEISDVAFLVGLGVLGLALTYISIRTGKVLNGWVFYSREDDPGLFRLFTILSGLCGFLLLLLGVFELLSRWI